MVNLLVVQDMASITSFPAQALLFLQNPLLFPPSHFPFFFTILFSLKEKDDKRERERERGKRETEIQLETETPTPTVPCLLFIEKL